MVLQALEHDLLCASSKDAALEAALSAAEKAMRLLKLSKDPVTSKSMNSKVKYLLEEAERIKFNDEWEPKNDINGQNKQRNVQTEIDVKKVIKLVEPVSSRKLSTAEKILLLKASDLNGFRFRPWDNPPQIKDFELLSGQTPFM